MGGNYNYRHGCRCPLLVTKTIVGLAKGVGWFRSLGLLGFWGSKHPTTLSHEYKELESLVQSISLLLLLYLDLSLCSFATALLLLFVSASTCDLVGDICFGGPGWRSSLVWRFIAIQLETSVWRSRVNVHFGALHRSRYRHFGGTIRWLIWLRYSMFIELASFLLGLLASQGGLNHHPHWSFRDRGGKLILLAFVAWYWAAW